MIVQCDKCQQQFDVPDAVLQPNGRKLKCANCGVLFFQSPDGSPPGSPVAESAADVKDAQAVEQEPPVKVLQESSTAAAAEEEDDLDLDNLGQLLNGLAAESEEMAEEEDPFAVSDDALNMSDSDASRSEEAAEWPDVEDPDDQEQGNLADVLEELQEESGTEEGASADEEEWATSEAELGEIDIDGDPELSLLEAMEIQTGEPDLMAADPEPELLATEPPELDAGAEAADAVEPAAAVEEESAEEEPWPAAAEEESAEEEPWPEQEPAAAGEVEVEEDSAEEDAWPEEESAEDAWPEAAEAELEMDEAVATQLATNAGRVEEGALTEMELEEEAAVEFSLEEGGDESEEDEGEEEPTRLATYAGQEESESEVDEEAETQVAASFELEEGGPDEDEDELIAAAKESYLPSEMDLLPEVAEEEPWPDEEEEATQVAAGVDSRPPGKIEPKFDDLPELAGVAGVANAVMLAKGSRTAEAKAATVAVAKPAAKKPMARRKSARAGRGQGVSKPWLSVFILLLASLYLLLQTDWWEYTWFNWRSPLQLSTIETSWRKYSFGNVLLVEGEVTNAGGTASPPWVHIALLDNKNSTLVETQLVPGRVVNRQILDGSGEQAIMAMIRLQGQERTPAESTWSSSRVPFQAIFINPPAEAARFQVDFDPTGQSFGQKSPQKTDAKKP
ncbi:MAG: zinc-ribbon domain-containing protein [Magnetococcales bacterium]|nr:zinc-ribbon domain-containing protein [Magnetococcales bacterium]